LSKRSKNELKPFQRHGRYQNLTLIQPSKNQMSQKFQGSELKVKNYTVFFVCRKVRQQCLFKHEKKMGDEQQGHQIGRIFAYWVIVYFGLWYKNYCVGSSDKFWTNFFLGTSYVLILTKNG
jgi:hypothetical protein